MSFSANPFLQRVSEKTSSDEDFVRLFSPKILDRLPDEVFEGGVHVFLSPPGGGKTMLLRAFTPTVLRAFFYNKYSDAIEEAFGRLTARGILDPVVEPTFLGVMLSCAFGYADLPTGVGHANHGLFRALVNCRVVLRSLKSLVRLLGTAADTEILRSVHMDFDGGAESLAHIPRVATAFDLLEWAEDTERMVYAELDSLVPKSQQEMPSHLRLEGVLWLQQVVFIRNGARLPIRKMLMIDDMHKLRAAQSVALREELIEMRPTIPVWLAQRSIALGTATLLSPGARSGRDATSHRLEELWKDGRGATQFANFAESILDRRMRQQQVIPSASFVGHVAEHLQEIPPQEVQEALERLHDEIGAYARDPRFAEWVQAAEDAQRRGGIGAVRELYKIRIRMARQERKRQVAFDFVPLPAEELEDGESAKDDAAAELFMHRDMKLPYYFGSVKLYKMATNNAEELLALGGRLFDKMRARRVLRKEPILTPAEQEKIFAAAAHERLEFIPKSHTEGSRARNLLKGIGAYCHERTYLPSASYAPGVTGVRLSNSQLQRLMSTETSRIKEIKLLQRVLAECVAENLLLCDTSEASGSREAGTIFWLNRLICVEFSLPLQKGCWQGVEVEDMVEWMQRGPAPVRNRSLELD